MGFAGSSGAVRSVGSRTDYLIAMLRGYDGLGQLKDRLAHDADWMLVISIGSFIWALLFFNARIMPVGIDQELFLLVIAFFWLSSVLFALFRATMFIIQVLMDRAVRSVDGVSDRAFIRRQRDMKVLFTQVCKRLDTSVALWWHAHRIIATSILVIIPAFCFYILGLSALMACVAHEVLLHIL